MDDDAGASELSCPVCKGYLIDAVTLTRCSHSFCRSCLLQQLKNVKKCPAECENRFDDIDSIGQAFCRDTTLQAFVYKYVPETFWKEIKQRADFIKKRLPTDEEREMLTDWSVTDFGQYLCLKDEMISFSVEYISREQILNNSRNQNKFFPSTSMEQEKPSNKKTEFCRYFRCPAGVKIKHLKMLLEGKLEIPDNFVLYFIELETEDIIEDNYTLQDLVYIFGWNRQKPLRLYFTLARLVPEEDKPPILEVQLADQAEIPDDSGPPQLDCNEYPKMPALVGSALTVNLSTAMFEKDSNRNNSSPNGFILPRMPIITTAKDGPPKKKRKREPKDPKDPREPKIKEKSSLSGAAKRSSPPSAVPTSTGTTIAATHQPLPDLMGSSSSTTKNNLQITASSPSSSSSPLLTKSPITSVANGVESIKIQSSPKISDPYQITPPESLASTPLGKLSTSPTLLSVEQSNKQLNSIFAPINSAPNTPLPFDLMEKNFPQPTLLVRAATAVEKSSTSFEKQQKQQKADNIAILELERQRYLEAMSNGIFKVHRHQQNGNLNNGFLVHKQQSQQQKSPTNTFLTMPPQSTILP